MSHPRLVRHGRALAHRALATVFASSLALSASCIDGAHDGHIVVTVKDAARAAVAHAEVVLDPTCCASLHVGECRELTTSTGRAEFNVGEHAIGTCSVTVEASGFKTEIATFSTSEIDIGVDVVLRR